MTTKQKHDLVDDIIDDHRELEAVFAEIEFSDQPNRELVEHVIAELVRHSVAEEQYLYPTARRLLPDGDALADHDMKEHAEAEDVMNAHRKDQATGPEVRRIGGQAHRRCPPPPSGGGKRPAAEAARRM